MKDIVIVDLDGTIALIEHRRHFVEDGNKQWDEFYDACDQDEPNLPVILILQRMKRGHPIYIFSGRSEAVRAKTLDWLYSHRVPWDFLFMRPEGDFTPDEELKKGWLERERIKDRVLMVIDDRQKVVDMWRGMGLTCFQVAPGNF